MCAYLLPTYLFVTITLKPLKYDSNKQIQKQQSILCECKMNPL